MKFSKTPPNIMVIFEFKSINKKYNVSVNYNRNFTHKNCYNITKTKLRVKGIPDS